MRKRDEITKRDNTRINKKKYWGVKTEINSYASKIVDHLYDPKLYEDMVGSKAKENISDYFQKYLDEINQRMQDLLDKAKENFQDSFKKGSKRIMNKDGSRVKVEDPKEDSAALDFLLREQEIYFKNLTSDQSKAATRIVSKALKQGTSVEDTSKELQSTIKTLTKSRANTIARSEIVKAHNVGQVETMKSLGVVKYHYFTANDSKVAKICKKHQGPRSRPNTYELDNAGTPKHPLPVINSHPNCRCAIVIAD